MKPIIKLLINSTALGSGIGVLGLGFPQLDLFSMFMGIVATEALESLITLWLIPKVQLRRKKKTTTLIY